MPTPFWVKNDYPLIKMAIYNGTGLGLGTLHSYTNFTVETTPGEIYDLGVVFKNDIVPSIDQINPVKVVDCNYFNVITPILRNDDDNRSKLPKVKNIVLRPFLIFVHSTLVRIVRAFSFFSFFFFSCFFA